MARRHLSARIATALVVVAPLLAAAGPPALASGATSPTAAATPSNGMIAVFAWKAGAHISEDLDLVVMNADGSGAQVVVPGAATRSLCGFDLDWSPDGNRIAWASGGQVWTVRADGTERTNIATGCVSHVEWSPDGTTLALQIDSRAGLLTVETGVFRWLRSCAYGEPDATFSPDGSQMASVATADCDSDPIGWGIYGFEVADGTLDARYADTNLRSQPPNNHLAAIPKGAEWHPTQPTILTTMRDGSEGGTCHALGQTGSWNNSDLYTVAASSDSALVKVGSTSGEYALSESDASWSPDGQRILFSGDRNVSCQGGAYVRSVPELFTMDPDGSSVTKVWTPWSAELGFVGSSWQPCTAATSTCEPVAPLDSDGDQVPDTADACPTTPGPASNAGCPEDVPPPVGDPDPTPTDPTPTVPVPIVSPSPVATAPSRLGAPRVTVRGRKAIVRWSAARPNGSEVRSYLVDISRGKDRRVAPWQRKTVFKGLPPGRYRFRVAATNDVGRSPFSVWVRARIQRT